MDPLRLPDDGPEDQERPCRRPPPDRVPRIAVELLPEEETPAQAAALGSRARVRA